MVINLTEMKRKRRDDCSSPLLDESPKRTKVHAQRKFAQGSNVNSPVITPVKEIEKQEIDVLPEPVELLPIKRPNTEDFLTFLCFRGTPILPPSLNFFNTASIVDTNGQVHEIKSESPKNGPIDTSAITKTGSGSSEKPFVAFGVRKRADPIVISRQMDKKRRHALALQALRRKYQEQRMAKIRAVTISKLSEKVSSKTLVRSNSVSKSEPVTKKSSTVLKSKTSDDSKDAKVTTRSVKASLRPQIKQKMCLRSFRGRFVQKELQFRNVKKRPLPGKKLLKSENTKKSESKEKETSSDESEYSSDDEKPLSKASKDLEISPKVVLPKIAKKSAPGPKKPMEINFRITRSNKFLNNKMVSRRQQIKQRMIMTTPQTIVKPRTLRSQSAQKPKIAESKQKLLQIKKNKVVAKQTKIAAPKKETGSIITRSVKILEAPKKEVTKKDVPKSAESVKKETKPSDSSKKVNKSSESVSKEMSPNPSTSKSKSDKPITVAKKESSEGVKKAKIPVTTVKKVEASVDNQVKKDNFNKKKPSVVLKKVGTKSTETAKKEPVPKKEASKVEEEPEKKEETAKNKTDQKDNLEQRTSQRPTRKTKEAAAIYMEILSHKLVNESKIDDDNVSIDSFPELPNVKKTEQRENELKAKAKSSKISESESDTKKQTKPKEKEGDTENKNLRSSDKKKLPSQKKNEQSDAKNTNTDKPEDIKKEKDVDQVKDKNEQNLAVEEKPKKAEDVKKTTINAKEEVQICDRKTRSTTQEKLIEKPIPSPLEKIKEVELKVHINPIKVDAENKKPAKKSDNKDSTLKKKTSDKSEEYEKSESGESAKQTKVKKSDEKACNKSDAEVTRRQTRNSSLNIRHVETDDSDESFRADVRIPRKKQVTRGKVTRFYESDLDSPLSDDQNIKKSLRANTRIYKECSSSDSDQSTTSDVNVKPIKPTKKNKKFTKTRGLQKSEPSFSDSDEEPLSKFTQSKTSITKDVTVGDESSNTENKERVETEVKTMKTDNDKVEDDSSEKNDFKKPKRECAKRPQNYLPMFSSSDEEDSYFQGFQVKNEVNKPAKPVKAPEGGCSHVPTTSDLSCKDIGRRFGKGKVNMSNEQIEKWLKDSAMAGSSVKTENDAMLKFGEKIPTETSHSIASFIDTEKLRSLLIANIKPDMDLDRKDSVTKPVEGLTLNKTNKPSLTDRKLIFRNKDKVDAVPNVNAFSASNESSVYAFGEETEDVMRTPFRRPNRRPSSTATSRSEDESSKYDESSRPGQFRRPPLLKQDSSKSLNTQGDETFEDSSQADVEDNASSTQMQKLVVATGKGRPPSGGPKLEKKPIATTSMVPPTSTVQKITNLKPPSKQNAKFFERSSETPDELKYKVPSSPSASSSSSAKLYKRPACKLKFRATEVVPVKLPEFPVNSPCGQLVEAPTFHPSEKEFQDPLEYIEKIRPKAEQFGVCRIVPPSTFKPECKVTDDMRFTAYNQYVHKMLHRWGPNFKELMAIKKYLSTQNISLTHPPWIGGMEVDLPRLYQTVQSLGGLKEVIEKKKWPKVSDAMKIPKSAQDRVTKLDDIYCKYLLPYDTLSPAEREKLFDEVETDWAKRESKSLLKAQQNIDVNSPEGESESDDEAEECIVKGRSMALNAFYRIARNTMSMWFKTSEPLAQEVEQEFWKHVTQKQNHICVHSGSIDSGNWGYGFAVSKNSPFARHAWNLKVLTNNSGSVLRSMGPIMGVTVPTLHVGMVFSSCCWYRDPHSLPWIEYLHTGGNKIWYGVPNSTSAAFHSALKSIVPNYCRNKSLWLPSDTVMVPPNLLVENGVCLSRIVQEPGQFIIVFPKVFTSSLSTGYVVSESVYFAPPYWLRTARTVFDELRNSCEPSMFSLDRLLLSIVNDARSNVEVLKQIIPAVQELCDKEKSGRGKVKDLGVSAVEKLPLPEVSKVRKKKKLQDDDGEYECEVCRMNLFVSMVTESQEDGVYCLDHAAELLENKKIQSKNCKLTYTYDDQELDGLVDKINAMIASKMQKKIPTKYAGLPTLLTK